MENPIKIEDYISNIEAVEKIIDYKFNNKEYLLHALTHPSAVQGCATQYSYERYEFLGDSLLSAVVSANAFLKYKDMNEGELTRVRVALVSGASLSETAKELGFADYIIFGKSEKSTGNRGMNSALENVFESICAAIFLDGGHLAAGNFIKKYILTKMTDDGNLAIEENPKSILQEKLQAQKHRPSYAIVNESGPAHDMSFVAEVYSDNIVLAKGQGKTKKEAEVNAAKIALKRID